MAASEAVPLYCWNGKTKVATAWTVDTEEPELCPANANCSVYLSEEQSLQGTPSFKIRFDNLVTRQCQPLIRTLFCDEPTSATTESTSQLSLPGSTTASTRSSSSSSSCSLILHPPQTANEREALQYNVTTRNFFAWIIGAPIVGADPTFALVALKARMDMWRNPSSDNIAAVQQYAKQQGYTEPSDLHLAPEVALQSAVSSAAEYKMSSAPVSKFSKSATNATMRLKQSMGKRAGTIMKRKLSGMTSHDNLRLNNSPSNTPSTDSGSGPKHPRLSSNVSSDDSDHSSSTGLGQASPSTDSATNSSCTTHHPCSTDVSTRSNLSLNTSISYTPLELPELEDILEPYWSGDDHEDKGKGKETATSQAAYIASLRRSPTFTESPRAYNNTSIRHSSQRDRRRPQSRAGSGPPSPILEEVVLPKKTSPTVVGTTTNKRSRRFSFESVSDYPDHGLVSAHSATTTHPERPPFFTSNSMTSSGSYAGSASQPQIICTACKRRKRPDSASTSRTDLVHTGVVESIPPVPPLPTVLPVPAGERPSLNVSAPIQHEVLTAPRMRPVPNNEARADGERQLDHRRFPSLYGLKTGSKSSSDVTNIASRSAFISRSSTLKQASFASQTSGRRFRSRTISEGVNSDQIPKRRGSIGTPLTEQCHTPPTRSSTLTKRRMSHETMKAVSTNVSAPGSPSCVDEHSLEVKADEGQVSQKPLTLPKRTTSKPPVPLKRVSSIAPVRVTSPEPADFPVLMKSNGSRHPLALMLQNESTCMVVSTSSPPAKHQLQVSTSHSDDTIMLDRLLEGFKFLDYPPPATPTYRSKTPTRSITPYADSAASPGRSSQLSPTSPRCTSSASVRSSWTSRTSRKSFTGSLRRWRSREPTFMDMDDPLAEIRPVSKNGSIQIRVLSMDSTGKFSTEYMDSPDELGAFPEFR